MLVAPGQTPEPPRYEATTWEAIASILAASEAGVDAVRTHRSFLVNRAAITETVPTGEGDVRILLSDGSEVPGSRRYREGLVG